MDAKPIPPIDAATTVEHSPEANDQVRPLILSPSKRDAIVAHLRAALPNEGCGLLASVPDGNADRAVWFFPGTNIDASPTRYTMDPKQVIDAMWWMRTLGWTLAAIAHSHPRSHPSPSRTDLNEWFYPEARLLIVSFMDEDPSIGCWALTRDRQSREFRASPPRIEER